METVTKRRIYVNEYKSGRQFGYNSVAAALRHGASGVKAKAVPYERVEPVDAVKAVVGLMAEPGMIGRQAYKRPAGMEHDNKEIFFTDVVHKGTLKWMLLKPGPFDPNRPDSWDYEKSLEVLGKDGKWYPCAGFKLPEGASNE